MTLELAAGLTLYFARHGQTQANVEKRFSGKKDTPLTALGREQAHEIGHGPEARAGDRARPSPLSPARCQRARTTMEIAREALELPREGYTTDAAHAGNRSGRAGTS